MLLGADINLSATDWSAADRIEAHFTSVRDGQISPCFKLMILTVSEEETRPPEKTISDQ